MPYCLFLNNMIIQVYGSKLSVSCMFTSSLFNPMSTNESALLQMSEYCTVGIVDPFFLSFNKTRSAKGTPDVSGTNRIKIPHTIAMIPNTVNGTALCSDPCKSKIVERNYQLICNTYSETSLSWPPLLTS